MPPTDEIRETARNVVMASLGCLDYRPPGHEKQGHISHGFYCVVSKEWGSTCSRLAEHVAAALSAQDVKAKVETVREVIAFIGISEDPETIKALDEFFVDRGLLRARLLSMLDPSARIAEVEKGEGHDDT